MEENEVGIYKIYVWLEGVGYKKFWFSLFLPY